MPPKPADEAQIQAALSDPQRLAAVRDTGLLDTPTEESFDRLTRLAAKLTGAPVTFVSLVDAERDFYKSAYGMGEPLRSTRELTGRTFCHYALASGEALILEDVTQLPVFRDVPTVGSLGVRAYAGIPLRTEDGEVLEQNPAAQRLQSHTGPVLLEKIQSRFSLDNAYQAYQLVRFGGKDRGLPQETRDFVNQLTLESNFNVH